MKERLGFDTVITGYGLTEASGIATMCRFDDPPETIAQTSGRAIPGVEVKIVDGKGLSLPAGEQGEVMIRGYNIMQEYFDEPAATQETIDADGWLRSGDIGVLNAEGYIRITDRQKDMFIVGGFNAYPAEIESTLLQRKEIAQAAVIGVPDERLGEVGAAYLVLKPGEDIAINELRDWCREHMANFKVPRHFRTVDQLPMNASGKVTKFVLRENFASDQNG
jgi:acyl-CoA synthetase (AMP-forming)/AMP-acid ligase II